MSHSPSTEELRRQLQERLAAEQRDENSFLQGVLHGKPLGYWDYLQVDTLLSLQKPRTHFHDERVFIGFHQICELYFSLILHELQWLNEHGLAAEAVATERVSRMVRYMRLVIAGFEVMTKGLSRDEFAQFRKALHPSSGFQSVQPRYIELRSTSLQQLRYASMRDSHLNSLGQGLDQLYWRMGGRNPKTGQPVPALEEFEKQYMSQLKALAIDMQDLNLQQQVQRTSPDGELKEALRQFDHHMNVAWPKVHLATARHHLSPTTGATGGTDWQKYLAPSYQKVVFFPSLWTDAERENWGK